MLIQIQHEYCTMIGYDAMNHGNSIHGRIKMQRQKFKLDHDFVWLATFCRIMMSSNNEKVLEMVFHLLALIPLPFIVNFNVILEICIQPQNIIET